LIDGDHPQHPPQLHCSVTAVSRRSKRASRGRLVGGEEELNMCVQLSEV
jgi:hypothetical protein